MSQPSPASIILAALVVCILAVPAGAVIQEVTVKGTVDTVNQAKNTLTIANPQQYGCEYPSVGSGPVCKWAPMNLSKLTSPVSDIAALKLFKSGDPTVGTTIGGAYDTWIALAKLYGSRPNEEYITDIVGDA